MAPTILPADPTAAVQKLIDLSKHLKIVMEEEARAITLKNEVAMLDAETLKEKLLPQYQQAAQEFSARVEEFRGVVSQSALDELQSLQDALGAVARENQFHLAS